MLFRSINDLNIDNNLIGRVEPQNKYSNIRQRRRLFNGQGNVELVLEPNGKRTSYIHPSISNL